MHACVDHDELLQVIIATSFTTTTSHNIYVALWLASVSCFLLRIFSPAAAIMQSQKAIIEKIAPELKRLVQEHEEGTYKEGVEAFNSEIMHIIEQSGLLVEEKKHVSCVGVHPHNREKTMVIPIDVHDLLVKFADNGYNPRLWDALALKVPPGEVGEQWRAANIALVEGSDGLLAPIQGDRIEIVTGRGSHGTAACRLVAFGAQAVHEQLAGADGKLSKSKLLDLQPSWREPLDHGLLYKVLPGELEIAVPGLLACLSRVGNASHDVYREPTTLQLCARIHSIAVNCPSQKDEWIVKQACVGNGGVSYEAKGMQLLQFVKAWSGGKNGQNLKDLDSYERSITVKRKLVPADLEALSKSDLLHAHTYIQVTRV